MKEIVNIVMPIYKIVPDEIEMISFKQAITVLHPYPFTIVSPSGLDLTVYESLFKQFNIEYKIIYFDKIYFESLDGYSKLMLEKKFYKSFEDVEYILIYQLDAYVFRDELKYWCSLGYDYVGAPWLENNPVDRATENVKIKFTKVGNGGFSLRRVETFIRVLSSKKPLFTWRQIYEQYSAFSSFRKFLWRFVMFMKFLGYKNNIQYYRSLNFYLEDVFYSVFLENTRLKLNIPEVDIALRFALEKGAKKMSEEGIFQLPFGCHAWHKHDKNFWKQYILN